MEILHPLSSFSAPATSKDSGVTVLVTHVVSASQRVAFLETLKELLIGFGEAEGAKGCKVYEETCDGLTRVTILQNFTSAERQEEWLRSERFVRWKASIVPLFSQLESFRSYSGVAALFAAGQSPDAPPRWKMSVVLLLAVFPLSLALSHWFGRALANTPPLIGALISSPIMVLLMTYVMVPLLTTIFSRWLKPASGSV